MKILGKWTPIDFQFWDWVGFPEIENALFCSFLGGWVVFWVLHDISVMVALREKLKKADPKYFSILGLGKIF